MDYYIDGIMENTNYIWSMKDRYGFSYHIVKRYLGLKSHILEKNIDKINWYYLSQNKNAIATLSNVTAGGQNIMSRYFFDNGQRDGYYDLSKIVLKTGSPKPSNKILIVFDYFTPSGAGDYFDVNSYSAIEYKDIPVYSPSRVDLGGLEPDGTYELSDAISPIITE